MRAALVHEHEALGINSSYTFLLQAALSHSFRSLTRSFFGVHPKRLIIRETVGSLTFTPTVHSRNSWRSERVAAGAL